MDLEQEQRLKIESTIRQHHQALSTLLPEKNTAQINAKEEECRVQLEKEGLLTTEVQRELDGMAQRILFSWLQQGNQKISEPELIDICRSYLGEDKLWVEKFRRYRNLGKAIVLNVLTWQCEMRCSYCSIPKQSGREMSKDILDLSAELLLSAPQNRLEMRYFGGEPLLEWEKLKYSIETVWNTQQCSTKCQHKELSFLITTNGLKLDLEKIKWMSQFPISLQIALDGLPEAQNRYRPLYQSEESSYQYCAINQAKRLQEYDIPHTVIIVIHPARVEHMLDDFRHIAEQGFEIIQINWAHNTIWHKKQLELFAKGLYQLSDYLRDCWARNKGPKLLNLNEQMKKVRTHQELTVDWDGKLYANNGFLFRPHIAEDLCIGSIYDGRNLLHYSLDYFSAQELDDITLSRNVFHNNEQVGQIFNSWIRWMIKQGIPDLSPFISNRYR